MLDAKTQIIRLLMAACLGGLIGLERERLLWVAGLRTHMMVCVGSALIMIVSAYGFMEVISLGQPHIEVDVARVAAQVVSGIGFLGAGTILFREDVVRGLTTAASLWAVAAIGLAVGGGLYVAAVATTLICLVILMALKPIERFLVSFPRQLTQLSITINVSKTSHKLIKEALAKGGLHVHKIVCDENIAGDRQILKLLLRKNAKNSAATTIRYLKTMPGVLDVEVEDRNDD